MLHFVAHHSNSSAVNKVMEVVLAQVYGGMMFMDFSNPDAHRWLLIY